MRFRSQEVIFESRPSLLGKAYLISFLIISSDGVGVSSSKFGRHFLLGLLYLPIRTRAIFEAVDPSCVAPMLFENKNHDYRMVNVNVLMLSFFVSIAISKN